MLLVLLNLPSAEISQILYPVFPTWTTEACSCGPCSCRCRFGPALSHLNADAANLHNVAGIRSLFLAAQSSRTPSRQTLDSDRGARTQRSLGIIIPSLRLSTHAEFKRRPFAVFSRYPTALHGDKVIRQPGDVAGSRLEELEEAQAWECVTGAM